MALALLRIASEAGASRSGELMLLTRTVSRGLSEGLERGALKQGALTLNEAESESPHGT